jgi:putative holliday junction resolvase
MPLVELADLAPLLARRRRLLGLDVGTKTIGLALSDTLGTVASPYETIRRGKFVADCERLAAIIAKQGVGGFLLGLPVSLDGSEGPRAQGVRQFARNLLAKIDLPLAFWDERLSTAAVTRLMIDADMTRKRRGELVDKMAAAYILQGALERLRAMRGESSLSRLREREGPICAANGRVRGCFRRTLTRRRCAAPPSPASGRGAILALIAANRVLTRHGE